MRIPLPVCGERDIQEFSCLGDATRRRPDPEAGEAAFADYVYLRDNPAGRHREFVVSRRRLPGLAGGGGVTRDTKEPRDRGSRPPLARLPAPLRSPDREQQPRPAAPPRRGAA